MAEKKPRRRQETGLSQRVDRLETWFVTALIALVTILGSALAAILLRP